MKYRRLGKTGLRVSVIGVGTWQFGGEWGKAFAQDEVGAMFRRAGELGINLVDTAECYGNHLSERLVGNAIKGNRQGWIVATKFGHVFHGPMDRTDARKARDARTQLEDSLRALQSEYIDVYQYHSVRDSEFMNEEVWKVLDDAKKAGKIRHIGNSISGKLDPLRQAEASGRAGVEVLQLLYNRLDRRAENSAFPIAMKHDLGVLARIPLASGFLTGKYKPGATFPADDFRAKEDPGEIEQKIRAAQEIAEREVPAGVAMAQWALAWCLQHPAVSATIPGCKDVAQVESNAAAADLPMVADSHPQAWK